MTIEVWVIDHRDHDLQPKGRIIKPFVTRAGDKPGSEYADYCALYNVWHIDTKPPDIVGFFGYRKYLYPIDEQDYDWATPAHAPGWYCCGRRDFDDYRNWLAQWDGADITRLLESYDMLVAQPFPIPVDIWEDFAKSRSEIDALTCYEIMPVEPMPALIFPYLFITPWPVFDRLMHELELIRLQLHGRCKGEDSYNSEYKKRPMAYVMERAFTYWLKQSKLHYRTIPLLHCWETRS
jgi:hypothetical protein